MKPNKPKRKPFADFKPAEQKAKPGDNRTLGLKTAAWRRLRKLVLALQPLCDDCAAVGIMTPATEVHHANGDHNDNALSNLVGLCKSCHSRHTLLEQVLGRRVHGYDVNGLPRDPAHPWCEKSPATDQQGPARVATRTRPQD